MSTFAPSAKFSPADIDNASLAELRKLALSALKAAPRFGEWLHHWCDVEQARRARSDRCCTVGHMIALPPVADWNDHEVGEAVEAAACLVHAVFEFTGSQFSERLALAIFMEAGHRLRHRATPENKSNAK